MTEICAKILLKPETKLSGHRQRIFKAPNFKLILFLYVPFCKNTKTFFSSQISHFLSPKTSGSVGQKVCQWQA
jgi:hypothetical protein